MTIKSSTINITVAPVSTPPPNLGYTALNVLTWTATNGFSSIVWSDITALDVFTMNVDGNGNITWNGTATPSVQTMVNTAHQHGVKAILSVGGSAVTNAILVQLLGSSAATTNMVNQIVTTMNQYGFDGVKIDFENPPFSASEFVSMIQELRNAIGSAKLLNVDTADWIWASQDISALEPYVDHFLNMLYNGTQIPLATCQTSMTSLAAMLQDKAKATFGIRLDYETQLAAKLQWARSQGYGVFFWQAALVTAADWTTIAANP